MDLHVLRRPQAAGLDSAGDTDPWCDRVVVPVEGRHRAQPWGVRASFNLLAGAIPSLPARPIARRLVAWSGWLPGDHLPVDGVFDPGAQTWMGPGRQSLGEACGWLAGELGRREMTLALVPHARHVLSDPPSIRSFFADRAGGPIELVLEPAALLTDAMLDDAQDHLERIYETLAGLDALVGVVLTNVQRVEVGEGRVELRSVPIHQGVVDPDLICVPARRLLPPGLAMIVPEKGLPQQLGLIRPAGRGG